jgi:hypothetical protein
LQRALIAFERFLMKVVDTTHAALAAAIGRVRLRRGARCGIGRIIVRRRGIAGFHDMLSGVASWRRPLDRVHA